MININTIKELYDKNTPVMQTGQLVREALELFDSSRSSAIVIIDDKKHPRGILTERDITKYAGHWDEILSLPVSKVMSSPVTTIGQEHDFHDAYMLMSENGFRHLVVVKEDGSLAGILDEGHFLRHLTPEQLLAVKEVKLVMSKNVTTVEITQSVAETIKRMTESKISSIIIVRDKKPLGIFTERDTVRLARHGDALLEAPISEHMSSPLKTIHEEMSVIDAEHMLTRQHIRHLVVINDKGELSGIVSQHDLVKGISGIYIEMLRDTIRRQSKLLHKTYNQLEEHSVLNNILDSFSDRLIIACDINSVIEFTNADMYQCLYTVPQIGQKLDESVQCFNSSISDSILNGDVTSTVHAEPVVYDKKGEKHYFKTSYAPIYSQKKLLQGFLFTAEDVTSEKQSVIEREEQNRLLKEKEEQLLQAQKLGKIGSWRLNIVKNRLDWSDEIFNIFEMDKSKFGASYEAFLDAIHPDDRDAVNKAYTQSLQNQLPYSITHRLLMQDGSIKWVAENCTTTFDKDGNPLESIGTVQDITQEQQTKILLEEQNLLLQEREQQLLQAQSIAKIGNWSLDIATMQAHWSQEIRDIIGIAADIDVGPEFLSKIVDPADWPVVERSLMEAIKDGKDHDIDYRIERPSDHGIRWVNCRAVRILDENQQPLKLVGTVQDITEKKEQELKIIQQEALFRAIFEQASVGVAQIDSKTGQFIKLNQVYADIVGCSVEEMLTIDFMQITHPDDLEEDLKIIQALKDGSTPHYSKRKRYCKLNGDIVWVNLYVSPLHRKDGALESHIAIVVDISKQVAYEEQINQYKHIVSATTDLVVFIDKNYKYIAVNDAYLSYHKTSLEEVVNIPVPNIIGKENFHAIKPHLDRAFEGHEFTLEVNDFVDSDGNKRYEEVRFYPYKNEDGDTKGVVLNIRDNTEKQIALQNEKKLLDLVDSSSNEIYVFDKESLRFTYANYGALSNLGYTLQELQTMYIYDIEPEYSKETFIDFMQPLLKKEVSKLVFETQQQRKDKTTYPIEVNLQLLKTIDGNEEFLSIITDITERKRVEKQLKQQEEMMIIQSRQAAMGEMISMIAHQWRQPLSVVSMIVNNLLLDIDMDTFDTVVAKEDFVEINDQLQYMSATIEDFRNFFKPSKEAEQDYVLNILRNIMKIIGPSLDSNSIQTEIKCDSTLMIQTYKSELKQVIINILSNAKDALKDTQADNKMIKISVKAENEHIVFSIFNNGPKIDSELLHRIFEPYFTTKEILGGTGIGLYMSKSIIEKHMHGNIEAKNLNKGVEFTIMVPESLEGTIDE